MSHFNVAVLHRKDQNVEELLAKYDENLEVAPYLDHKKSDIPSYVRRTFSSMADKSDQECYEFLAEDYAPEMIDAEGNLYSTYNPNSKWDWWEVGGRWRNMLHTKAGEDVDEALVGEIDFTPDPKAYEYAVRFWEVHVEGKPKKDEDHFFAIYKPEYYLEYYGTKERYAEIQSVFRTFAVVTPDGKWHEKGQMGWWGMSFETPADANNWHDNYMDFFKDPDLICTIVDCHI